MRFSPIWDKYIRVVTWKIAEVFETVIFLQRYPVVGDRTIQLAQSLSKNPSAVLYQISAGQCQAMAF